MCRCSDKDSNYNALQVYATKRKGDFMASLSYTLSKVLTDASVLGAHSDNPVDRHYSYGVADYDRRNILAVTYIYASPFFRNRRGFVSAAGKGFAPIASRCYPDRASGGEARYTVPYSVFYEWLQRQMWNPSVENFWRNIDDNVQALL